MSDAATIYTTASRGEVADYVRSIPGAITGGGGDHYGIGHGFRARLAFTFFSLVLPNFVKLGRGQVGEDNERWPRNSPKYLAYGKGPKSSRMGRGRMPMNFPGGPYYHGAYGRPPRGSGELTEKQLRDWFQKWYWPKKFQLLLMGYPYREAQRLAAQYAWENMKKSGAKTLLTRFGNRPDQVLKDRGLLERSLQPGFLVDGVSADAEYQVKNTMQIAREEPGSVVVGTNHPHAEKHHEGKGKLPQRRLWPKRITPKWFDEIVDSVLLGLMGIERDFN